LTGSRSTGCCAAEILLKMIRFPAPARVAFWPSPQADSPGRHRQKWQSVVVVSGYGEGGTSRAADDRPSALMGERAVIRVRDKMSR
jgi:hypothetical protein